MRAFRRLLAPFIAALLIVSAVWSPAAAVTAGQRLVILSGVQGWSFPGSSADLNFALNAGSCTINRLLRPCSQLISTTRAQTVSSYAQWADGHFSAFSANVARITDQGLLVEQASTNKQLWSNDWTNAAYVKVNVTAAMDQSGPDNVANSASSLTATANAGTILQTVTEVATANTASVYLKRITGTGAVTLVQNGVSGTTCTLTTTSWTVCSVTATVLNPAIGLIMATSGDKIAVWDGQFVTDAFVTSPIPTTTVAVARNADVITLTGAAATAALAAKAARFETNGLNSASTPYLLHFGGTAFMYFGSSTAINIFNGTTAGSVTIGNSGTFAGLVKSAFGMDATSYTALANGGSTSTTASAWAGNTGTVALGSDGSAGHFINGFMRRTTFGLSKGQYNGTTSP